MKVQLLLLTSLVNAGDVEHVQVIQESLGKNIEISLSVTVDASQRNDTLSEEVKKHFKSTSKGPVVVLAVGHKGGEALGPVLKNLKKRPKYVYLGLHQYEEQLSNWKCINHLMIPSTAVNTPEKKAAIKEMTKNGCRYTETFSVPSKMLKDDELKKAYDEWEGKGGLDLKSRYIIVSLPGDAPDPAGKINVFSKKSAEDLFSKVKKLRDREGKKIKLIVQNGPRTGKFDPLDLSKIKCKHEYKKGENPNFVVDDVSSHFIELVKKEKIPYQFYNFAWELDGNVKTKKSVYEPLLYVAKETNSLYILNGESVTDLGKVPSYLKPQNVIAFEADSMNEGHKTLLKEAIKLGYVSYFGKNGGVWRPKDLMQKKPDEASIVADKILEDIKKKFTA